MEVVINDDASENFSCVGGYPGGVDYDMHYGNKDEYEQAAECIRNVALPENDPVYGKKQKIFLFWKK